MIRPPLQKLFLIASPLLLMWGCDGYVVRGSASFGDEPFKGITAVQPHFWFRSEERNVEVTPRVKFADGQFKIYDLPAGTYGMSMDFDANQENPAMYPGDYTSWTSFSVTQGKKTHVDVGLTRVLHLTSPQDNGSVMTHWNSECDDKMTAASPVTFSWEPIGTDVYYDYYIERVSCEPYKSLDTVTGATTQDAKVTVQLPASAHKEFYQFSLSARKNGKHIGTLITHGGNGYGWDYRFRVK